MVKMEETAVFIKNANKSYGDKQILDNLCMNVPRGTIYGLLGASGCGKTTLLSSIVGRKKLNSGNIWVLGEQISIKGSQPPGPRIGYMPQDVALVAEFSVKDAVYYFGRIYGMSEESIEERFRKLGSLLDLPPDDRLLKDCSGGQQRRVSFAAAMIHDPELLIMDEPTVGLDPVLRDNIWNYLIEITEKLQVTVIITTHYIEEARQAHKIGLMRDGKLLAEESPERLLTLFRTDTLEEVFLILSRQQVEGRIHNPELEELRDDQNNSTIQSANSNVSLVMEGDGPHASTDMLTPKETTIRSKAQHNVGGYSVNKNRLKALLGKNWKQYSRNLGGVAFTLMFPIFEMLAFLLAVGTDMKDIKIGVVNNEVLVNGSCHNYSKPGSVVLLDDFTCEYHDLSCRFLDMLVDPMIALSYHSDVDTALDKIRHGKLVGVMEFTSNFSASLQDRFNAGRKVRSGSVTNSFVNAWLDMSNRQIGTTLKFKLLEKVIDFQKIILTDCNLPGKAGDIPIKFEEDVYGDADEEYSNFMIPGVLLSVMFFMGTTMTSTIIITDRLEGVWDRSIVAGVSALEIMITHFVTQFILILVQSLEVIVITFFIYQVNYIGSLIIVVIFVVAQGLCGMSYGFWVSVVSSTHSMANIVATGSFYPMILVCGLLWPLEGMPVVLRWFSKCLPFTIPITSLRNVIKKGWDLTHLEVLNGIGVSLVWIIGLGLISTYLIKSKS